MSEVRYAAIDIGSNSIRLLTMPHDGMAEGTTGRERWTFMMEITRLGAGMSDGALTPEAIERSASVIARYVGLAREQGIADERLCAFATAALREAANGAAFIDRVEALCGVRPEIITGEREAHLAYLGVRGAYPSIEHFGVLDIGGNSTEWLVARPEGPATASVGIGAGRLMRSFPPCDIVPDETLAAAQALAREALMTAPPIPAPFWVGISATVTTAAAVMHRLSDDSPRNVNGLVLYRRDIEEMNALLAGIPLADRKRLPSMPPERADLLPFGLCIVLAFMEMVGIGEIWVNGYGNLHGAIVEMMRADA